MPTETTRTLMDVLKTGADYLAARGVENPRLACELLAARLLRCKRLELYLHHEHVLGGPQLEAMRRGVKRVGAGEPVQYVLGRCEFRGHVLQVDRRALIPRPETEILVEQVLACEPVWKLESPAVADIGTGSGCIILSLAVERPAGRYAGLDTSEEAVQLARENAATLGVADRVHLACRDLADVFDPAVLDLLVSNPPYIPTAQWEALPVHIREHEPRQALDGGADGLTVIREVIQDAAIALKPGGRLLMEIGDDQAATVSGLLTENGFGSIEVYPDLAGRDRVVEAVLPA